MVQMLCVVGSDGLLQGGVWDSRCVGFSVGDAVSHCSELCSRAVTLAGDARCCLMLCSLHPLHCPVIWGSLCRGLFRLQFSLLPLISPVPCMWICASGREAKRGGKWSTVHGPKWVSLWPSPSSRESGHAAFTSTLLCENAYRLRPLFHCCQFGYFVTLV